MTEVARFFQAGGSLMYVNLLVAVVALTVVAERFYVLKFRLNLDVRSFLEAIEKFVMAGNYDRAIKLCGTRAEAALPKVVRAGLSNARKGGAAVTAALEEAMADVSPRVTKRAGLLFGVANIATLIGLIGTIFGLIDVFAAQAMAAPELKSQMLTAGIAHAMNNTAFGLGIAVVCIIFHLMLSASARNIMEGLEYGALRLENIIAKRRLMEASGQATTEEG